jgi:hypothetical protein
VQTEILEFDENWTSYNSGKTLKYVFQWRSVVISTSISGVIDRLCGLVVRVPGY